MKIACIIPSRYASTRLPGKPLRMIAGKTLVRRVYERAILAKLPDVVIVATDHKDIEKEVRSFGGDVVMTSANHPTGTDRLAEVAASLPDYDIIVNVQGDEPLIDPNVIDLLAKTLVERAELDMIKAKFPDGLAVDMESAAMAQVCHMYGVPFLSLRIISDTPGIENHQQQYESFWDEAPIKSLEVVEKLLAKL